MLTIPRGPPVVGVGRPLFPSRVDRDVTTNKVLRSEAGPGEIRPVLAWPPTHSHMDQLDPALGCSGLMSIFSYDSHPVSRRRNCDELPRRENARRDNRSGDISTSIYPPHVLGKAPNVEIQNTEVWSFFSNTIQREALEEVISSLF